MIIAALGLLTIREQFDYWVILALILLVIFLTVRIWSGDLWPRSTGLDGPVALFVLSAAVATWIAYDFSAALLQFARILAAVALFTLIATGHPGFQRWLAIGFLLASCLLALYWPLQHDFSVSQGKFQFVDDFGYWIEAHLPEIKFEAFTGPFIHANVAAATMALAVPFGLAFVVEGWTTRRIVTSLLAGLATLILAAGLLLTGSRGTWAGLVCASLLFLLAWIQRRWFTTRSAKIAFWTSALLLGSLVLLYLVTTFDFQRLLGTLPGPPGAVLSRVELWRQGWGLARDYFFTGSGLGTFWMVHAFYSILLHVPYIAHTHNTFLEVWIEQGILGAAALLWGVVVLLTWYWRALDRKPLPLLGVAGLFALTSMALHGIVDVVFYIERTLPLVGFVLGYAWLAVPQPQTVSTGVKRSSRTGQILTLAGTLLLILYLVVSPQAFLSRFYANLGALSQTRAELRRYDLANYDKITVDQLRRGIDYSQIEPLFHRSLSRDPGNQTSLQRLSMIALSRGEYEEAWRDMQVVWAAHRRDITSQLLYADAAIANGHPEEAAVALQGNPLAEMHLMGIAWYRFWIQGDFQRAYDSYQAVLLLNPANDMAQNQLKEASRRLNP